MTPAPRHLAYGEHILASDRLPWDTDAGCSQLLLVQTAYGTTLRQLAVNHNGWYARDAQLLRPGRDLRLVHIENLHLAGRARE